MNPFKRTTLSLLLFGSLFFLNPITGFCQQPDSITVRIKPSYDSVSGFHRILLGKNYRKLWGVPVTVRIMYLSKEKGGLKIAKEGGGMQTRSLRLLDPSGKEWVLRTLEKYPERKLPPALKKTIARDILNDQISTANPFAAVTVPVFAEALSIPHANPEVVYLASEPVLGEYRADFADKVYLLEERGAASDASSSSSDKVLEKLEEDNDVSVDQVTVLRARLLDILLGDWDRHKDQWRWEKTKDKKETTYTPIPRDRDQVYYKTSGVLPWIVSHQYLASKFQGFNKTIRDINGWNLNARYFDRLFMTSLDEAAWKEQIAFVQTALSDSLIRSAISLLPPNVYALSGEETIKTLIARRNRLEKYALHYYRFISKAVDIAMSDKKEFFDIRYADSGRVTVDIYKIKKDGSKDQLLYQRSFNPGETKEIRLYGRGGEDLFSVTGDGKSKIRIRMVGGGESDTFNVDATIRNRRHLFIYDREDKKNTFAANGKAKLRLKNDSSVNVYEPFNFKYNRVGPEVSGGYNSDDDLLLRLGFLSILHGFRKEPYASKQEFWVNYSTGRHFFRFTYEGDFKHVIKNNDLYINIIARGPDYVRNFFGIGNETTFPRKGDRKISYYRTRYDYLTAESRLRHPLGKYLSVSAGLRGQYYVADATRNKNNSLEAYNALNAGQDLFGKKYYGGAVGGVMYDSRNDEGLVTRGIYARLNVMAMKQFSSGGARYGQFNLDVNHYLSLNKDSTVILANRLGAGTITGNPAFFQYLYLGGGGNGFLRGYRSYRFAGKSMAYHNIEMRFKLFDFTSYLFPGRVGITAFNDIGRVWMPEESSGKWHDGYGGGIYIQPAQLILVQIQKGHSTEGWQTYIQLGFRF